MIVADTGAILALVDTDDRHHKTLLGVFRKTGRDWVIPWAVLPEVDYLLRTRVDPRVAGFFLEDIASGALLVEWGVPADLRRARELNERYPELGLVDAVVMATAERIGAKAIATLDLRHFSAVELASRPELWPRDFAGGQ